MGLRLKYRQGRGDTILNLGKYLQNIHGSQVGPGLPANDRNALFTPQRDHGWPRQTVVMAGHGVIVCACAQHSQDVSFVHLGQGDVFCYQVARLTAFSGDCHGTGGLLSGTVSQYSRMLSTV